MKPFATVVGTDVGAACQWLSRGCCVGMPTETVYGLVRLSPFCSFFFPNSCSHLFLFHPGCQCSRQGCSIENFFDETASLV